ncbi:MAG: FAD-binding protein [Acidimicrobiaceae bacterium]|nr:FAD-binding protein [Acidimicrobiaceae bacterium]
MRIAVLVKQIPDPEQLQMIDGRVVRDGVPLTVSAYCRRANAKAVELAGSKGGEVMVFTMGPPSAEDALQEMIFCGATRGVHLCDPVLAGSDTLATAVALAAALRQKGPFDLVLAGLNSLDSDTGQVPAEVAELLGLPFAAGVRELEINASDDREVRTGGASNFKARLETDDGYRTVEGELPAVLSTSERLCYPSKAPPEEYASVNAVNCITRLTAVDLQVSQHKLGVAGSPTTVGITREIKTFRHPLIVADVSEAVDMLVDSGVLSVDASQTSPGNLDSSVPAAEPSNGLLIADGGLPMVDCDKFTANSGSLVADRGGKSGNEARSTETSPVTPRQVWCFFTEAGIGVELLQAATELARNVAGVVAAVTTESLFSEPLSAPDFASNDLLMRFEAAGADRLLIIPCVRRDSLSEPAEKAEALADAAAAELPWVLLVEGTRSGRSVAAKVAARHGWGLTGDAVDLKVDDRERLVAWKPAFSGQLEVAIHSRSPVQMATVRPGALLARGSAAFRLSGSDRLGGFVPGSGLAVQLLPTPPPTKIRTTAVHQEDSNISELRRAATIVAVGQGVDSAGYPLIDELRVALGGAVLGATRKVTDRGWIPRSRQIGVTGHFVAPQLLVSVGASGRFNHTVGIRNARTILAVNADHNAEIFGQADIGIVGDWQQIITELVDELKTRALTIGPRKPCALRNEARQIGRLGNH